jgi:hypothetical protein
MSIENVPDAGRKKQSSPLSVGVAAVPPLAKVNEMPTVDERFTIRSVSPRVVKVTVSTNAPAWLPE